MFGRGRGPGRGQGRGQGQGRGARLLQYIARINVMAQRLPALIAKVEGRPLDEVERELKEAEAQEAQRLRARWGRQGTDDVL